MKTFGLLGKSLLHSFSKSYFDKKFESENLNYQYLNFELNNIEDLPELLSNNPDICGLNVTIPYKQQVIKFLNEIDKEATFIGAVNTIRIIRKGNKITLIGYNTDAYGFEHSLKLHLKKHYRKALVLGTGGASKAVGFVLRKHGISVTDVSRHPLKLNQISYEFINKNTINDHLIIINTTPLGMHPNESSFPKIPYEFIGDQHLLFDLVYNPAETIFLKKGKENGANTVNGTNMLHLQAEQSWKVWNY